MRGDFDHLLPSRSPARLNVDFHLQVVGFSAATMTVVAHAPSAKIDRRGLRNLSRFPILKKKGLIEFMWSTDVAKVIFC